MLFKNNKAITEICNSGPQLPSHRAPGKPAPCLRLEGVLPRLAWDTWCTPVLCARPREAPVSASLRASRGLVFMSRKMMPNVFILGPTSPSVFLLQNFLPRTLLQGRPLGVSDSPLLFTVWTGSCSSDAQTLHSHFGGDLPRTPKICTSHACRGTAL